MENSEQKVRINLLHCTVSPRSSWYEHHFQETRQSLDESCYTNMVSFRRESSTVPLSHDVNMGEGA